MVGTKLVIRARATKAHKAGRPLSKAAAGVLEAIRGFWKHNVRRPRVQEIASLLGRGKVSVWASIQILIARGELNDNLVPLRGGCPCCGRSVRKTTAATTVAP